MTQDDSLALRKYIGIPWVYKKTDCWGVFKMMSNELLSVSLPDLNLPDKSSIKANSEIFENEILSPRWERSDEPRFGSAVVFYGNSEKAIHIGFAIDSKTMIHSMGTTKTQTHSRCDKIRNMIGMGLYKRYEFYNYVS